jgi:hypothetical protein
MNSEESALLRETTAVLARMARDCSNEEKTHFTHVIKALAECYVANATSRAVLIVSGEQETMTLSINADMAEMAGMVQSCYDNLNLGALRAMPEGYQPH